MPPGVPPELGEHTAEVRREARHADADLEAPLASGAAVPGKRAGPST